MRHEPSPYHSSRGNWKTTGVVIHTTVGNYEGTINWFKNNSRNVSAHYVVKEDGSEVTQMVDESRAAHHAGIVSNPTTPVYRGSNPNFYTIGIENADAGKPHTSDRSKQKYTIAKLVREICDRNNIPIDRDHICGHREIRDTKTCPGNLDVDEIVQIASSGTIISEPIAHDLEQNAIEYLISKGYKTEGDIRGLVATVDAYEKLQVDHANLITKYENALAEFKIEKNKLNSLAERRKQELDQRAKDLAEIYGTTQEWSKIISEAEQHIGIEDRLRDCQKALQSAREGIPLKPPGLLETFISFLTSLIEYNKRITKIN